METTKLYNTIHSERSEEVQHIIERMPTRFGFWVSLIVLFIFTLMILFGWFVRYPDVVVGQININANSSPIKLVANSYGKLKLKNLQSMDSVNEGEMIAYIENSANPLTVQQINSLLIRYSPNTEDLTELYNKLPKQIALGELNGKYYALINALQDFVNYRDDKLFDKQLHNFEQIFSEQDQALKEAKSRIEMSKNNIFFVHKFFNRDSILYAKRVISESEFDKSQVNYNNAKDGYHAALSNLISIRQQLQQTRSKIQELGIAKPERENELKIKLISTYTDLTDNIKSWEQKYVFKAPFDGNVQFLKFYNENQFIQSGEPVVTVVPRKGKAFGQVFLPAQGTGKIKLLQEVIVKLDDYPYMEYGSITGKVSSISLTTTTTKTKDSEMETYLVLVDFPNQLRTNYGANIAFRAEAKGSAEIITNDRRLIERLFDNMKYLSSF